MNRRGFFTRLAGCLAGTALARYLPTPPLTFKGIPLVFDEARVGTVGAIDRATYSFWRNQQTLGESRPIDEQVFTDVFNACGSERLYFMSANGLYEIGAKGTRRL
jgi:hypothetical protein